MPSDFTFVFPELIDYLSTEQKGNTLVPISKSTLFPDILQDIAKFYHQHLTLSQYNSLTVILKDIFNASTPKMLKDMKSKHTNFFCSSTTLQILINVLLEARNQTIKHAIGSGIDKTEGVELYFLIEIQKRLLFTYTLFMALDTSFYSDALERQRSLLLPAFYNDIQCGLSNLSALCYLPCNEVYQQDLRSCFEYISELSLIAHDNILPKIITSKSEADNECYMKLIVQPLYWTHYKAKYFFAIGDKAKAISHLKISESFKEATLSSLINASYLQVYNDHYNTVQKLNDALEAEIQVKSLKQSKEDLAALEKQTEKETLEKENADLNSEILNHSDSTKEQLKLDKEITTLRAEMNTIKQKNGALEGQCAKAKALKQKDLMKNTQQLEALAQAIKLLKTTNISLHQNLEDAKARQLAQSTLETKCQQKKQALMQEKAAALITQKEYEDKLLDIQAAIKAAQLKETQLLESLNHVKSEKEKTQDTQSLKKQLHNLRVENIGLLRQTQGLKSRLKQLTKESQKFDFRKGLEYADLRRDFAGFDKISKLLPPKAPRLRPSNPPPTPPRQPYGLCAPLCDPVLQPILHQQLPPLVPTANPDPLAAHRRAKPLKS